MPAFHVARGHSFLSPDPSTVTGAIRDFFLSILAVLASPFRAVAAMVRGALRAVYSAISHLFLILAGPFKSISAVIARAFHAATATELGQALKATVLAIVHAFQHLWLFLFGPESVATYHPYLVGISLLGLCEPKFLLVIVAALYSAFTVVLWVLLVVIGFAFKGVRGASPASAIQSSYGSVPAGSAFASAQSFGARGPNTAALAWSGNPTVPTLGSSLLTIMMWVFRVGCGAAGVYVLGREWALWA